MLVFINIVNFSPMCCFIIVIIRVAIRSCLFYKFPFTLQIFLYGGYSKEVLLDKSVSEKGIVHSDMWSLDPKTWEWNKVVVWSLILGECVYSSSLATLSFPMA